MRPLISIILPTYNREHLLDRCLDSIHTQTETRFEVVIVDDHSSDQSAALIRRRIEHDSRLRLFTNRRTKGISGARNTGLEEARGEFISFQDSDDTWSPSHLADALECLTQFPEIDCYSSNRVNIDKDNNVVLNLFASMNLPHSILHKRLGDDLFLVEGDILDYLLDDLLIDLHTLVIRASRRENVCFNEKLQVTVDRQFAVELAFRRNLRWALRDKVGAYILRHEGNITTDSPESCIRRLNASVGFYRDIIPNGRLSDSQRRKAQESLRERLRELPYHYRQSGQSGKAIQIILGNIGNFGVTAAGRELTKTLLYVLRPAPRTS